jgi:S1-C subfamily serine protease
VAVVSVDENSLAQGQGFQPGDIVRNVNGANISRVADLTRALNAVHRWELVIERGGRRVSLAVED